MKKLYHLLTFLPLIVSLFSFSLLPEQIPAHFNLAGEVDRWGSRLEIFFLPVLVVALGLLFRRWIEWTLRRQTQNSPRALYVAGCAMLAVFNGIFFVMLYTAFASVDRMAVPGEAIMRITNLLVGLLLIPIGNVMPKVKRNAVFGLRTKWSMANDTCWNLSQRFGGLSFVVTGCLIVLGSILVSDPAWQSILMITLILLDTIFCVVYSYQVYRKYGKN